MPPAEPFVTLGGSAVSWIEHYLIHGPGDVQGQRIEMDDEFAAFVYKCYRLDPITGRRRVKRAFLSRSKGRAKSEIAGWVACFEALGPCRFDHWAEAGEVSTWGYEYAEGEPVGRPLTYVEILCVATEEGQAGNTYDVIHYNLDKQTCSPELAADFPGLDVGLSRVSLPDARGSIEPETAGDSSKDGGKSTFIVSDETHLWLLPRLKRMHQTMARNLNKRKLAEGWMLETSTMYGEGEGSVAEGTHAYAMLVRTGKRKDAGLLFDHRQASTTWDLSDREQRINALREAYGPAAEWMPLDDIADMWDDPQVTEAEWRRYWVNQPVPMSAKPVGILPKWDAHKAPDRKLDGTPTLALATAFNRAWTSIGAAVADGSVLRVKVLAYGAGQGWVIEQAKAFVGQFGGPLWLDPKGPAGSFRKELVDAGVWVEDASTDDICDAAALLVDATECDPGDGVWLEHYGQPELDAAVQVAAWRNVSERRALGRRASGGDISALEACGLAALKARDADNYDVMKSIG